jgi:hypothetical protein
MQIPQIEYVVSRRAGRITDHLLCLFEGDDSPQFGLSRDRAYRFSDRSVAERIVQRLQVRYPHSMKVQGGVCPFDYAVVPVRKHEPQWRTHIEQCSCCGQDTFEVSEANGYDTGGRPLRHEECSNRDCRSNRRSQHLAMFM